MRPGRGARARGRSKVEGYLPLLYFVAAIALTVVMLPSVLRQLPPEQSQSAELSPDAPPDESQQAIISSLNRASSATAGVDEGLGEGPAEVLAAVAPTQLGAPCKFAFGSPARQAESVYSPACIPGFKGDNGGATAHNVFPDEVRVGYWHGLAMPRERGLVQTTPPDLESAEHRTLRVLQQYFNSRYELYGRELRINAIAGEGDADTDQRNQAVEQDTVGRSFAVSHIYMPFCEEAAARKMVCYNVNSATVRDYEAHGPYWWSYYSSFDENEAISAEYACKKLVGRKAEFAAGIEQGKDRVIGLLTQSNVGNNFHTSAGTERQLIEQCGYDPPVAIDFAVNADNSAVLATAIARLQQQGVTTIIASVMADGAIGMMASAQASNYFPEWVLVNSYGLDLNNFARNLPPSQSAQLFGLSGWELPRPLSSTDCFRAYKAVDPDGAPDADVCQYVWPNLEQIVIGLQNAGPALTPESFRQGMYRYRIRAKEIWAIGGGYAAREHGFVDTFAEQWWSQTATDPRDGATGTYLFTQQGKRVGRGDIDTVTRVFSDGIAGIR